MLFALVRTFLILIIGIFSGYLFKKLSNKKNWLSTNRIQQFSTFLQKIATLGILSITYIGSLWTFQIEDIVRTITMPFVDIFTTLIGGMLAIILSKYLQYKKVDTGSMFLCGALSNRPNLGGMICFFYLGEAGYALVPIYTFFTRLTTFGIIYPISYTYSSDIVMPEGYVSKIVKIIKDPFFL